MLKRTMPRRPLEAWHKTAEYTTNSYDPVSALDLHICLNSPIAALRCTCEWNIYISNCLQVLVSFNII